MFFVRLLAVLRRVSARIYALIVVALLGVVYALVLPFFAVAWRLRGRRPGGWKRRDDPRLTSIERLRSLF